ADVNIAWSAGITALFLVICLVIVWWMFRTGYKIKK
ncbi:MAG: sugar ABC transporter permease, partial [Xanthobacteraceae bacterium]|nr:sugar ABC transporter permease [Xanthobacteraceae bacterium]